MSLPEKTPLPVVRALGASRDMYWRIRKPTTFGAAVALTDVECKMVALVRPTYGRGLWQLPGGGIDSSDKKVAKQRVLMGVYPEYLNPELFEPSARRELKEELGFDVADYRLDHLFTHVSEKYGNKDTLGIFHLPLIPEIVEFKPQKTEIAEVKWWSLDNLPFNGAEYLGALATKLQKSD